MQRVNLTEFLSIALFVMAIGAGMGVPKNAEARHCAAIIYEDANYEGAHQCLQVGEYNVEDLAIRNDSLSSIKVAKNNVVVLFKHKDFSGAKYIIHHDHSYIGDKWNDITSSIVVE